MLGRKKKKSDHTAEELYEALKRILRYYNMADVRIKIIHADNEFRGVFENKVEEELKIKMNFANPNEHVPDIERANRLLEERFRVAYYRMPFKVIPAAMIQHLGLSVTDHITWFPAKKGISQYFSLCTILAGKQIDFKNG